MLSVLGLGPAEEQTYRHLVSRAGLTVAAIAAGTGRDPVQVGDDVDGLIRRGLVVADPATGEVSAAPPAVALGALLRQQRDDLRSAELELLALVDEYRGRAAGRAEADLVEVITDVDAVRHRFAQIQQAARHEMRTMVVPNLRVVPGARNRDGDAGILRGVRYRAIVDRALLGEAGAMAAIVHAVGQGEEIRVVDRVPVKLVIADSDVAMVPLRSGHNTEPESVLIRASGLLDALIAYFDAVWSRAYPVVVDGDRVAVSPDGVDEVDAQVLTLLLAGLTDQAVASQLGLSLRSVQRRIAALMAKAGATTRIQLGWHAARHGWA